MKAWLILGTGALLLGGCGGGASAVGENSADSVTTTAVGNVVAAIPSPTPTPDEAANAAATTGEDEAGKVSSNDASDAAP